MNNNHNNDSIDNVLNFCREQEAPNCPDLWDSIESKLDSKYHSELWAEDAPSNASPVEKYTLGLSEYLDSACSAEKSQIITEHLLECDHCREIYLSFTKIKRVLEYSFSDMSEDAATTVWNDVQAELFPEDLQSNKRKAS